MDQPTQAHPEGMRGAFNAENAGTPEGRGPRRARGSAAGGRPSTANGPALKGGMDQGHFVGVTPVTPLFVLLAVFVFGRRDVRA